MEFIPHSSPYEFTFANGQLELELFVLVKYLNFFQVPVLAGRFHIIAKKRVFTFILVVRIKINALT